MNLLQLRADVEAAIEHAGDSGADPNDILVSIQIDLESGEDSLWSEDVKLIYDNDGNASGCVIYGWEYDNQEIQRTGNGLKLTPGDYPGGVLPPDPDKF